MKKIIALITIITLSTSIFAQREQAKHEVSLWGAYGLSTLNYDLSYGKRDLGLGFLAGIGYNYFLNYHWSIGIGAEFQQFTSALDLAGLQDNYSPGQFAYYDPNGVKAKDPFISTLLNKYDADYLAYYVNVPLQVKYQLDAFKTHKWYAAANLKFGIPVSTSYSVDGNYNASAVVPYITNPVTLETEYKTLITDGASIKVDKEDFAVKVNTSIGLETGIKWNLGKRWALYTGIFADYGLFDIRKGELNRHIAEYAGTDLYTAKYVNNPALNSSYIFSKADYNKDLAEVPVTKRVNTLDAGIKLQLALGFGGNHVKRGAKEKENELLNAIKANKPLTKEQLEDALGKNTDKLIQAGKDNVKDLKDFINDKFKEEKKEVAEGLRLETVWGFDLDKTVIKKGTMDEIASRNLETLLKHPEIRVNLVGNTDDYASDAYNMDLGTRRAQAMKDWLVSKGIAASRLVISSEGKKKPFVANIDEANRRYNRRVEFIIIK